MGDFPDRQEDEDSIGLTAEIAGRVRAALEAQDGTELHRLLAGLHPADIADLLEQIDRRERQALIALWRGGMADGEVLSELDLSLRAEVMASLAPGDLAQAMATLESDDLVDLVEDLRPSERDQLLGALPAPDRVAVEQALAWPEGSAGRLMQSGIVWVPEHWTAAEATAHLRDATDLPDQFYHVILVDPRMRPVAYVTLGRLLSARPETRLATITEDSFRTFLVSDDESEIAYAFNHYHLISAPVVDQTDRLVGVITIDDAMAVLDDEHEEDMLRMAGVGGEGALSDDLADTVRQRLPWLCVNLVTAALAALVIAQFADTIAELVILAALMPIVASMGGNAGTQALAVAVRALATRDLTRANAARVVRREALVGLVCGLALAVVLGLSVALIFGSWPLGGVIASALVVNLLVACLSGVLVPLALSRIGADPALASGTFVTTMTDVTGFFAFLGLAALLLT